jgi:hypothetical protein
MNEQYTVVFLGPADSYGIATRRVSMLELICRGMTMEAAQEVCQKLNTGTKTRTPRRD